MSKPKDQRNCAAKQKQATTKKFVKRKAHGTFELKKKKKKSLHIISPTEAMLAQFNAYPGWLYIEVCRA